ncbi:proton-coupled folate transporter-like isoform X1 [Aricia agestis]|uniref:proton-coupled folate transporter-like isoform X1 n=1 Tax=Aricia agestis TaxID=91739 RepID=UPI001C20579C|nr:proton-coupled folate transporter-like isoform X1 [Aricia agestis]
MENTTQTSEDIEQSVPLKDGKEKPLSVCQKLKVAKDNVTVEPVLFSFMIASMISVVGFANLNLDKACRVNLGYNDSVCTALMLRQREKLGDAEVSVQKLVASVEAWRGVIATVFPIITMIFLGAWSDKMGKRKVCMLLPIGGELASSVMNIISTYFFHIPVELTTFFSAICIAIGGSWHVMYLGTYSYVADITSESSRTFRIGLLTLCLSVSIPIGMGVSGFILRHTGYYGVFGITTTLHILNFLYVWFRIKENGRENNSNKSKKSGSGCVRFLTEFFNWQSVKDLLQLLLKRRPNNRRMKLGLVIIASCLLNGPIWGEISIVYIMCRYRFNWDEIKYGVFASYNFVVHTIGTLFAMSLFAKKLKMDDSSLGIIATLSRILGALVWALARNDLEIYLAPVAEFFDGMMIIALRAMASKFVTSQELGKVFSLFGVLEVVMMLVLSPVYSRVYIATLAVLPGAAYFITALAGLPAVFIFIWFHREYKRELRDAALSLDCTEEVIK